MTVEHDRLESRQQIVRAVDVCPTHLRTADRRIGEVMNEVAQEVRLRHKVRIEDRDQLTPRGLHSILKRSRFEARAIVAMNVTDVEALRGILGYGRLRDLHRLVG